MIVYKLTSPSGKSYIGLTTATIEARWKQHVSLWKKLVRQNTPFIGAQATPLLFFAFSKYGPETFTKEVLFETDDKEILRLKEKEFISTFDTTKNGYNVLKGGQTGWYGKSLSEEHKRKQSEARKAWYKTPDGIAWRQHLSEKYKGNLSFS